MNWWVLCNKCNSLAIICIINLLSYTKWDYITDMWQAKEKNLDILFKNVKMSNREEINVIWRWRNCGEARSYSICDLEVSQISVAV